MRPAACSKIAPVVLKVIGFEKVHQELDPIRRIIGHIIHGWVVTGAWPSIVFEERNDMAKPLEADEILEMMPSVTTERVAHKKTGTNNLESQYRPPTARETDRT